MLRFAQRAEAAILTSMGTLCYQLSRYNEALTYHGEHHSVVKELGDRVAEGCAYGNLGIVHKALGNNNDAIKFHLLELAIASEVCMGEGGGGVLLQQDRWCFFQS